MNICEYGCKKEAKFQLKNGKWCCEQFPNKCLEVRLKNSNGLKLAYESGKKDRNVFSDDARKKSNIEMVKNAIKKAFVKNSIYDNTFIKDKLVNYFDVEYECNICKISEWQDKFISLELDHKNGTSNDNRLINLQLLCPNCHSQTNTFRGRNINSGKNLVSDDILIQALNTEKNIRRALLKVGLAAKGGNYFRCQKLINKYGLVAELADASGLSPDEP